MNVAEVVPEPCDPDLDPTTEKAVEDEKVIFHISVSAVEAGTIPYKTPDPLFSEIPECSFSFGVIAIEE